MAKFKRFNGSVVPFASYATGFNRTIFGEKTQSNEIDDNLNDKFKLGWEIVGPNEAPTKQDFNALGYTTSYLVSYLYQDGIPEWSAEQDYYVGSVCKGTDGNIYKSMYGTEEAPNKNIDPVSDNGSNWIKIAGNNIIVKTVKDLIALKNLNDGDMVKVLGYHTENDGGGGTFIFRKDLQEHNGGTFINIGKSFPTDWSDTTQQETWFNEEGLVLGTFERILENNCVTTRFFGSSLSLKTKGFKNFIDSYNNLKIIDDIEIDYEISFQNNNVILNGNNKTIKKSENFSGETLHKNLFYIKNSNIQIFDLVMDYNETNIDIPDDLIPTSSHCIKIYEGENIIIENCSFLNSGLDAIAISGGVKKSKNIKIKNCKIQNYGRNGISILWADGVDVKQTTFDTTKNKLGASIDLEPNPTPEGMSVKNIIVKDNISYRANICNLQGKSTTNSIENVYILNNTIDYVDVALESTNYVHNLLYSNNVYVLRNVYKNVNVELRFYYIDNSSNIFIKNNAIEQINYEVTPILLYTVNSHNVTFSNNKAKGYFNINNTTGTSEKIFIKNNEFHEVYGIDTNNPYVYFINNNIINESAPFFSISIIGEATIIKNNNLKIQKLKDSWVPFIRIRKGTAENNYIECNETEEYSKYHLEFSYTSTKICGNFVSYENNSKTTICRMLKSDDTYVYNDDIINDIEANKINIKNNYMLTTEIYELTK